MAVTPEIQGLDSGVGLVPQGRLGSGIANVFDTNVAQNLARLGARMENLDKLKLATAAKLASAKQKEAVVKGLKLNPFEAIAASGKAAFRSGNKVIQKLYNTSLNEYTSKKSAGDIEGANQVVPLAKYAHENVNNKTASIESDIDNFWAKGAGKFYLPNDVVESNIESARPEDYEGYLGYDEGGTRYKSYKEQPATYNLDAVGQWAKDESGRTTFQKKFEGGTTLGASGISALFKFPVKNGKVDENADLEIDYDVAKNFYSTNPYIREQMQTFGNLEKEKAIASEAYSKAATDAQRQEILKKAIDDGENNYIYATLSGRADKDVRKDLESTYRRAANQKKGEKTVEEDYIYGEVPFNFAGRVLAPSVADPKVKTGIGFDYNFGIKPSFDFSKNPQELSSGTKIVPMGDPEILSHLGLVKGRVGNGKEWVLQKNMKVNSAWFINDANINQTKNRQLRSDTKSRYIMPEGILLPQGESPLANDEKAEGFVVMIKSGPAGNLTKEDYEYLMGQGYTRTEIQAGLNIPVFVKRDEGSGATLLNFINKKFPNNQIPRAGLTTSNR